MDGFLPRIILPGGSGLLGSIVGPFLAGRGYQVVILSRSPQAGDAKPNIRAVQWDGRTLGPWQSELEGAAALVSLAGRSVDCRYTPRNRRAIFDSRILSTRILGEAIARCVQPPKAWLNASTATIYKHSLDRPMDEATGIIGATPEAKDTFSIKVATAWEAALRDAPAPRTRKVAMRTAMVLAASGDGVYPVLRRLVRAGLGGKMGPGTQYMSWIHERDFCRAIAFLLERFDLSGPINLAAPNPVPNAALMKVFRQLCRRPLGIPTPRPLLEIGAFFLRTQSELILKSRRVVPTRLLAAGFHFEFPALAEALRDLEEQT